MGQLGAVTRHHKHEDKHWGQNVPLGGGGAHKQVHECGEEYKDDHQRDQADVDGIQEIGTVQSDDSAQLGVAEVLDELGGDENQGQEGTHGVHAHLPVVLKGVHNGNEKGGHEHEPIVAHHQLGSMIVTAVWVMPASMGSVALTSRLAEKPPDTPAKAAARPAMGWRPQARKTVVPRGISTT